MKRKIAHRLAQIVVVAALVLLFCLLTSCRTQRVYVPVETVRTEYNDRYLRDSVYLHDSVMVKIKGDTIWLEKYKYLYRDKLLRDSVFINDTIRIPYPVAEYVEVNKLRSWQHFFIWCGAILLVVVSGYAVFRLVKWKLLK